MRGQFHGGRVGLLVLISFGWLSCAAYAGGQLRVRPGFNLFSPQQDVQVGRENATDIDKKLPLVTDPVVVRYVNNLGRRLATYAPYNNDYPWTFKVINSQDINAFALPGGYIYINRGAIEAAEEEAQLAGGIAHEISHVALRHGTNQATKRVGLSILTGILDQGSSLTAQLAKAGVGFGVNSLLLKNSRTDESQADEVGTYIMHEAGYDPHAMAQFFQIIGKKYPQRTLQFFSDHPNPENRVKDVNAFIATLGPSPNGTTNSREFEAVRQLLLGMPPPPKTSAAAQPASSRTEPPTAPSAHLIKYQGAGFSIDYPDNWQVYGSESEVKLAPAGGLLDIPEGEVAQAYGASITLYHPQAENGKDWELVGATQQLVGFMRQSNPNFSAAEQSGMRLRDRAARSTAFVNVSPVAGQKERGALVTIRSQDRLLALVFVSPEPEYDTYKPTFAAMLKTLVIQ